jgi:hypothetical protein
MNTFTEHLDTMRILATVNPQAVPLLFDEIEADIAAIVLAMLAISDMTREEATETMCAGLFATTVCMIDSVTQNVEFDEDSEAVPVEDEPYTVN